MDDADGFTVTELQTTDNSLYASNFGASVGRYYNYALSSAGTSYGNAKVNDVNSANVNSVSGLNFYTAANAEFSNLDKEQGANNPAAACVVAPAVCAVVGVGAVRVIHVGVNVVRGATTLTKLQDLFFKSQINVGDEEVDTPDTNPEKFRRGRLEGETGFEGEDGSWWSPNRARNSGSGSHGGTDWKRYPSKRDAKKDKGRRSVTRDGKVLRE